MLIKKYNTLFYILHKRMECIHTYFRHYIEDDPKGSGGSLSTPPSMSPTIEIIDDDSETLNIPPFWNTIT